MDLRDSSLSSTYQYLLSVGPTDADRIITLGNGAPVPWEDNNLLVTTDVQQVVFGNKTFVGPLTLPNTVSFTSNGSIVKSGNYQLTFTNQSSSSLAFSNTSTATYTIPNVGSSDFVMSVGDQLISGNKTFVEDINISGSLNAGHGKINYIGISGKNTIASGSPSGNSIADYNTGSSSDKYNSFGSYSSGNNFANYSRENSFGSNVYSFNKFGNNLSGNSGAYNDFGRNAISGAQNNFGPLSVNYFGQGGENYFYSGFFEGPITMPQTGINFYNNGSLAKNNNHALSFSTIGDTTVNFASGNITVIDSSNQQTISGLKEFTTGIKISATVDQLVLGSGLFNSITINATQPATSFKLTIPDISGNADFILSAGNQTINGQKTFSSTVNANITGNSETVTSGVYLYGDQNINGIKQFTQRPLVNGSGVLLSGEAVGSAGYTQYKLIAGNGISPEGSSFDGSTQKQFSINSQKVAMTTGDQIIHGLKSFAERIFVNKNSNQFVAGTGANFTYLNFNQQNANRIVSIPTLSSNSDIVLTSENQTISGTKTFTSTINASITGNAGSVTSGVYSYGNQTINGLKNFTTRPTVNGSEILVSGDSVTVITQNAQSLFAGNGIYSISGAYDGSTAQIFEVDSLSVLFLSGDQTISGIKTFDQKPQFSGVDFLVATGIQSLSGTIDFGLRPTVSGIPVVISGDSVGLSTNEQLIFDYGLSASGGAYFDGSSEINLSIDTSVVIVNTGDQAIAGVKSFIEKPQVGSAVVIIATGDQFISGSLTSTGNVNLGLSGINNYFGLSGSGNYFGSSGVNNYFGATTLTNNYFGNSGVLNLFGSNSSANIFAEASPDNKFGPLSNNEFGKSSNNLFGESGNNIYYSGIFTGNNIFEKNITIGSANLVLTTGSQAISGIKTLLDNLVVSGSILYGKNNTVLQEEIGNIIGGSGSFLSGNASTILGGTGNYLSGNSSFIGVGYRNKVLINNAAILNGEDNQIVAGGPSVIGGGSDNYISGLRTGSTDGRSFIGNGYQNKISAGNGFIGNGNGNEIYSTNSAIVAGIQQNKIFSNAESSFIGNGFRNEIFSGTYSFIGNGRNNDVWKKYSTITNGELNIASGNLATVINGSGNNARSDYSLVANGRLNNIGSTDSTYSVILNGNTNTIGSSDYSIIGNGQDNQILFEDHNVIIAGTNNLITGSKSTIAGGTYNTIYGNWCFAAGGANVISTADYSSAIGRGHKISGSYSHGIGRRAAISSGHDGAIVLADGQARDHMSAGVDTLSLDFYNGVFVTTGLFTAYNGIDIYGGASFNGLKPVVNGSGVMLEGESLIINEAFTGSSSQPGSVGQLKISGDYLYICTGVDSWGRIQIQSF